MHEPPKHRPEEKRVSPEAKVEQASAQRDNRTGLPTPLLQTMEGVLGHDLSQVRVHPNSPKAPAVGALAYAQGTDVHVAPGQFNPNSSAGKQLLGHELTHVVQQAQGRVRPTGSVAGVAINDDPALEREADVLGSRAVEGGGAPARPPVQQRSVHPASRAPIVSSGVAQRAGHEEDLCVLSSWVIKRADRTEIQQYVSGTVNEIAPEWHGPFSDKSSLVGKLGELDVALDDAQNKKVEAMSSGLKDGKQLLILKSVTAGMENPSLRDLKMGKHTASGTDQKRRDNSKSGTLAKVVSHDAMDMMSGSRSRGFRDEDSWKGGWFGDNLAGLKKMLRGADVNALQMVRGNMVDLLSWINSSATVYVGMSVLVAVGDPSGPQDLAHQGKAVAIDFEHPIEESDGSFKKHMDGIVQGIQAILGIIDGIVRTKAP